MCWLDLKQSALTRTPSEERWSLGILQTREESRREGKRKGVPTRNHTARKAHDDFGEKGYYWKAAVHTTTYERELCTGCSGGLQLHPLPLPLASRGYAKVQPKQWDEWVASGNGGKLPAPKPPVYLPLQEVSHFPDIQISL